MSNPQDLQSKFNVPGVRFDRGNGDLTRIVIDNDQAQAHVYLHGAHVTHFQPRGHQPVLMLSNRSNFADGKPIRGGVPVCFPWFGFRDGHPDAPLHGFVRTREWSVDSIARNADHVELSLSTRSDDSTRAQWPHEFLMRHDIRVGPTLEMSLSVRNTGAAPMKFEEALHTYFSVGDVTQVRVSGLKGAAYLDKNNNFARVAQVQDPIVIDGKSDRVYLDTRATCLIADPSLHRTITVEKRNSDSTVLWCPWMITPDRMADMGEGQWQRMLCIETCNVSHNAITLPAGATHTMSAMITVKHS